MLPRDDFLKSLNFGGGTAPGGGGILDLTTSLLSSTFFLVFGFISASIAKPAPCSTKTSLRESKL